MAQMGRPFMRLSAWNSVENIACPGNAVFHGVQHGVLRLAKRHVQKLAFLRAEFAQHVPYHFPFATGLADAETEAGRQVAVPGTSEHQLGLAVDIVDLDHQLLDESQEQTAVQQWLMANSWRYGFILRYPTAKTETTGIIYEPWHYRYVGQEAAAEIYQQGVCLEEYIAAKYGA